MKTPMVPPKRSTRSFAHVRNFALLVLTVSSAFGCGAPAFQVQAQAQAHAHTTDAVAEQAQNAETQGRMMVRTGTDRSICDASLVFARSRLLGEQTGRSDIARRGQSVSRRLGQACAQRVTRFWRQYRGCATPISGRELETSVYWESGRIAAFQQYGLGRVSTIMEQGRLRWQATGVPRGTPWP